MGSSGFWFWFWLANSGVREFSRSPSLRLRAAFTSLRVCLGSLTCNSDGKFRELTHHRPVPSVPACHDRTQNTGHVQKAEAKSHWSGA